jgi:hypothetical protein
MIVRRMNALGAIVAAGVTLHAASPSGTAGGLLVGAGVAGAPPHEFGRESNSAKNPSAHLVIPAAGESHVVVLPTDAGADSGTLLPVEPNVGGGNDAFTLQR